jgi:sigma-B regulation protein RsbU (phosphoserine phosphatase)
VAGWELAARFEPARRVAGDFYDAFLMTQGRRIGVVIADVCDKGVGSALFMALVRSLIRAFAQQNFATSVMDGLGEDASAPRAGAGARRQRLPSIGTTALMNAVVLTNNYVTDNHLETNYFATLFFAVADPDTGTVAYINGGHNPPYILSPEGVIKEQLKPTGPAVGIFPGAKFTINTAQLAPGDTLFMFTDGVTDARNPTGASVTTKGLVELISRPPGSAVALVDYIGDYLRDFIATADQFDDITMLALHRQA